MREIRLETLPARLPARPLDSHKGDWGAVGVLGGAPGMAGAALLAARAALWCGAGRVYVGLLDGRVAFDPEAAELMVSETLPPLPRPACLVAGPGLGASERALNLLEAALESPHALLLDADALNLLARHPAWAGRLKERVDPTLLTPHPGEAGRLLGVPGAEVQADRPGAVLELSRRYRAIVALKGAGSLVRGPEGEPWRNTTGNPGMAAPGMGDVLSGIVAALLVQGLAPLDAALAGVWLHGAAGDAAVAAGLGPRGLTATEVAREARRLLNAGLSRR